MPPHNVEIVIGGEDMDANVVGSSMQMLMHPVDCGRYRPGALVASA